MLCSSANQHRQPLPGYEKTYNYFQNVEQGYIYFLHARLPKRKIQDGWKFHISVGSDEYERAWPIVVPILLDPKLGMCAFKVIDLTFFENPFHYCSGKQFVCYVLMDEAGHRSESPEHIFTCLLQIERALRAAKIRAGSSKAADLKIMGSRYCSMRHDLDFQRSYVSPAAAYEINPTCAHNPFQQINPYADFAMCHPSHRFFSGRDAIYHGIGHADTIHSVTNQHGSI